MHLLLLQSRLGRSPESSRPRRPPRRMPLRFMQCTDGYPIHGGNKHDSTPTIWTLALWACITVANRLGMRMAKKQNGANSKKRVLRPWSKEDHRELKQHSKTKTPVAKI